MNISKINFYSKKSQLFFLYLFILTPVIIFFSKFLADFFLSIVSIYVLVYLFKNQKIEIFKYFLFFFIFIIFISINLLIQKPNILLFIKSFLLIRFPLFMLFPFVFNFDNKFLNKKFLIIFLIPIIIFLLNLYLQTFFYHDILGNKFESNYERVSSFFGSEYIAGGYLFFIFSIIILITKNFKIPVIFLLIIIYFGIFFSGDRTPFLNVNFLLILLFVTNIKKLIFSQKFVFTIILIPILIGFLVTLNSYDTFNLSAISKYKNTYKNIINDITNPEKNENHVGLKRWAYFGLYSKSLVILNNNKFFGTTYKSFRNECKKEKYDADYAKITGGLEFNGCSTHPHNIYLEILSEQGIIGFFIFILVILNFFRLPNKFAYFNNFNYKIFLIVYFFPFKPFGSFYSNFNLIMFSATIALFVLFNKKANQSYD